MTSARCSRLALIAGAAGSLAAGSAGADPVVRTSATITAGVAYERNPFLIDTPRSTDAASAQVDIRPRVEILDQRTQATIAGFYNRNQYFTKYDGNDGAGVDGSASYQVNSRWTLGAQVGFQSTVLGANNGFGAFQDALATLPSTTPVDGIGTGTETGTAPPTTLPGTGTGVVNGGLTTPVATLPPVDVGLIGLRQRRNSLTSSASINYLPSARSTWTLVGYGDRTWYPNDQTIQAQDYRTLGGTLGYNRRLSETTTVGARVSASFTKYDIGSRSNIYSPQVTYTRQLPRNWSVDLAVGASIVDTSGRLLGSSNGTTFNAQGSVCHTDARESFCLSGARAPSVSGFSGVTTQTSASASYSRRLDERSTIAASAGYSHVNYDNSGAIVGFVPLGNQDFWSGTVSYSRRLNQRLSAVATAGYRDVSSDFLSPRSDLSGRIGLSVALGSLQ